MIYPGSAGQCFKRIQHSKIIQSTARANYLASGTCQFQQEACTVPFKWHGLVIEEYTLIVYYICTTITRQCGARSLVCYHGFSDRNPSKKACADPESFVRGGPALTTCCFILVDEGKKIQMPLVGNHHRPASETPFWWRFTGGPIMT